MVTELQQVPKLECKRRKNAPIFSMGTGPAARIKQPVKTKQNIRTKARASYITEASEAEGLRGADVNDVKTKAGNTGVPENLSKDSFMERLKKKRSFRVVGKAVTTVGVPHIFKKLLSRKKTAQKVRRSQE